MPDDVFRAHQFADRSEGDALARASQMAEQAVLGALLSNPKLLEALPETFDPTHYGYSDHEEIHRAIAAVGKPGEPALIAVGHTLSPGDKEKRAYLGTLVSAVVSLQPSAVRSYAAVVTDHFRRRAVLDISDRLRASAHAEGGAAEVTAAIAVLMSELEEATSAVTPGRPAMLLRDAVDAAIEAGERARAAGGQPAGLLTGWSGLDAVLGGLEPGALYIAAGRPGMGKTSFGAQIGLSAARSGAGVLIASLEMQASQIGRRVLSMVSGVPLGVLRRGGWDQHQADVMQRSRVALDRLPLSIEDQGGLSVQAIALKARAAKRRHGLGLLVVDHLHIVGAPAESTRMGATWAVGQISNGLKKLAKEFDIPVLALAQLNRSVEGRDDKRPSMADLRQSGEIEQDAEAIMLLYRPEYYLPKSAPPRKDGDTAEKYSARVAAWHDERERLAGKAEVILPKVRDGEPTTVMLRFDGARTCFEEPHHG